MGLRGLFTAHPRLPRVIARGSAALHRAPPESDVAGVLGPLDRDSLRDVAVTLDRDGYYVFPESVGANLLIEMLMLAEGLPASPRSGTGLGRGGDVSAVPSGDSSSVYDWAERDLLDAEPVQLLACDPTIVSVADRYLGTSSVLTSVAMWRSLSASSEPSSVAAQLFHSDRDHLAFLKFFVYLSDVSPESGPHVFVRGSHRVRPLGLRRDVRFGDAAVRAGYDPDAIVEICGPAGTIFAADTAGLHKGKLPEDGDRLVFQLEFASSLFPLSTEKLPLQPKCKEFAAALSRGKRRFRRFAAAESGRR